MWCGDMNVLRHCNGVMVFLPEEALTMEALFEMCN